MALIWWEKTVEYQFVLSMVAAKNTFWAPLDGDRERAGDAIFSTCNKWLLIEFKKDKNSISSEKGKFARYEDARKALAGQDHHHFIIFGQEQTTPNLRLKLRAQTYFSGGDCDISLLANRASQLTPFTAYVGEYASYKKPPGGGGGNGSNLHMDQFAMVAGVGDSGKIVSCMSLTEFQLERGLLQAAAVSKQLDTGRGFDFSL